MIDDVLCKDSPSQPFFMRLERAEQVPHRGAYRVKFMQGRWEGDFFALLTLPPPGVLVRAAAELYVSGQWGMIVLV